MIIAVLVMVILSLLGISFLLMAETENRIAENERLSAQALYVGEAGARQVRRWFDHPPFNAVTNATNVINPPLAAIDRTLRQIDADGDPSTAPVLQDGSAGAPRYKQGVDRDADGTDDLFDRPYRSALVDTLLGTEAGPDMRISEATAAGKTFLAQLSQSLVGQFPGPGGVRARITQIDIYAPPYIDLNGNWTRYGMGTVRVVARIYRNLGGNEEILAERMVKAVLNETPYPGPFGPLHSCSNLGWNGDFTVYWGASTAVADSDLTNNHQKIAASFPRLEPPGQRLDLLWGYDTSTSSDADFQAALEETAGRSLEAVFRQWFPG